jgi:lysophospholipase L1-like esterase
MKLLPLLGLLSVAQATTTPLLLAHEPVTNNAPTGEPMNVSDVQRQNKYPEAIPPANYAKWNAYVSSRSAEEQEWLHTLEDQLGSYYLPRYINDFAEGRVKQDDDCWAFVKDDPKLPRILILGDSISRSYTSTVRRKLQGKANVHRAPANCGGTADFFGNGEVWLKQGGSDKWDIITVNYGIHDDDLTSVQLTQNLQKIFARLKQTGARIYWVRTTPWSKKGDPAGMDRSPRTNVLTDTLAKEQGFTIIDVHDPVLNRREELQIEDHVHFKEEGQRILGETVAGVIDPSVK